jgi:hypothetical protein
MGRGMGQGMGQGAGQGMRQGVLQGGQNAAAGPAVPTQQAAAESLSPREYLQWLEAEMRHAREQLSREG